MIGKKVIATITFDSDTQEEKNVTIIDSWETTLAGKKYLVHDDENNLFIVHVSELKRLI